MIDFENPQFIRLKQTDNDTYEKLLLPLLIDGEDIVSTYQGTRDGIVFTNKRIIAINIQGITGKKKDITSMPYSKIQTYSVETSGVFDLDAELSLYFSTIGKIRFEFSGSCDMARICRIISNYVL
ncbi:PH domain-containing protein [Phocea massiliensis]|uniref:PH domain-containing protein n=1 Tax=Merdimmobilis hominis TaxID=2897707 RepID=A0A938X6A2_9FIRM|nr:PH domain-containing protein [Merdimmobilis hominis]MBM6920339.1 PH domain-containing protein [Merdimmobilis hominis]